MTASDDKERADDRAARAEDQVLRARDRTERVESDETMTGLLNQVIDRADAIEKRLLGDKQERAQENIIRDRRIKWSRIAIVVSLIVGVLALIGGLLAKATTDDIIAARTQGRAATCQGFEALINALVVVSDSNTSTDAEKADLQKKIDVFVATFEHDTSALKCDFHIVQVFPSGGIQAGG